MEKEKYERTELEIIQFLTSDAVMLSLRKTNYRSKRDN